MPGPSAITRGALIVLEGLDRSGKSTQCQRLSKYLREQGQRVKYIKFPDRSTAIGKSIDAYLRGESQQEDHVIHLLFAANRWEAANQIRADIEAGITVIIDRYYISGVVYTIAKGRHGLGLDWAKHPESGLPKEDLTILLVVNPQTAHERDGYGEELYENTEIQKNVHSLFNVLLDGMGPTSRSARIDAGQSIDEVELDVREAVTRHITPVTLAQPLGKVLWE